MVTFTFGSSGSLHFVLPLAAVFNAVFLLMESRRYQIFDLWRRRFRLLNRYLVTPVLATDSTEPSEYPRFLDQPRSFGRGRREGSQPNRGSRIDAS